MATVKPKPEKSGPVGESEMQRLLVRHFDWYPNTLVPHCCLFGWECDLLVVSRAGVITEVEIKRTLADWNVDQHKEKWRSSQRDKINRFYYCIPAELEFKVPAWVPDSAGILLIDSTGYTQAIRVLRGAKLCSKYRLSADEWTRLSRLFYCRFFSQWTRGENPWPKDHSPLPPPTPIG